MVSERRVLQMGMAPIASAAVAAVIVPLMSWTVSTEDIGRFNLLQTYSALIAVMLAVGLDQSFVRYYHEVRDDGKGTLFWRCFLPVLVATVLLSCFAAFFSSEISATVFQTHSARIGLIALAVVVLSVVQRFMVVLARMRGAAGPFLVTQVAPKGGTLVVLVGAALLNVTLEFNQLAVALLFGLIASAALVLRQVPRRGASDDASVPSRGALLKYGLPLAGSALAYSALQSLGSVGLSVFQDVAAVGVFAVAVSLAAPATIVQVVLSALWAPIAYRWASEGVASQRVPQVLRMVCTLVTVGWLALGSFAWLAALVVPGKFSGVQYLVTGAIGPSLLYAVSEVSGIGIGIAQRSNLMFVASLVSLGLGVAVGIPLIQHLGTQGAVLAVLLANTVMLVARTELSATSWQPISRMEIYPGLAIAAALSAITVSFGAELSRVIYAIWFVTLMVAGFVGRHELAKVFRFGRNAIGW